MVGLWVQFHASVIFLFHAACIIYFKNKSQQKCYLSHLSLAARINNKSGIKRSDRQGAPRGHQILYKLISH